jgi:type I restriction-modification system DNA methylase subunit
LVNTFEYNIDQYKSKSYDEANTRVDFIDKFFECLDWDVRNTENCAEQYRQVVREDKVTIQGKPKAPDYSFRIYGQRKFFVEAKKPSVDIVKDSESAFQIRRYGYTANLPLSILTNFEHFIIYDTRIKPTKDDNSSVARINLYSFKDYVAKFEEIYGLFAFKSILKGSFDKFIQETKSKKGTSEVDKEFLKVIDEWRINLAKNIALRNKDLSIDELNYSIQKIIDRIIFLRISEDRQTEEYKQLFHIVEKENNYKLIDKLFKEAYKKYNSDIFRPEEFISKLSIDDNALKSIIKGMYYPDCPYEFSVLPIEILGNIYEQFLGKTIRLTPSHQAKIEEKPEVKKAGGVYYTPQYIVDYIVKNTVGEKINELASQSKAKDKQAKPEDIEKIKILDPACGSGSFLIGAYDYLLRYHLDYYTANKTRIDKAIKDRKLYLKTAYYFFIFC